MSVLKSRYWAALTPISDLQNVTVAVEVNYHLGGASFVFPPQDGSKTDGIASSSKREFLLLLLSHHPNLNTLIIEVTFSANPDVGKTLGVSAHFIPEVSLGINALDGLASASVFLDLDASLGPQVTIASGADPQPCMSGNADINVGVGTQGSFLDLFGACSGKSLFDKNFTLF
jgi:hypothetical protein